MDKCGLENILTLTKSLITLYLNGAVESSNKNVRNLMEDGLDETLKMQDNLYGQMKDDSFYKVENVKASEINKLYNKLNKDTSD